MHRWLPFLALVACKTDYDIGIDETDHELPPDTDDTQVDTDVHQDTDPTICEVADPPSREEVDNTCGSGGTPPADPWRDVLEWSFTGGAVYATPVIGDLDGDGVPSVVFNDSGGVTRVLNGATGAEEWSVTGGDYTSGCALADVDNDGDGDVIRGIGTYGSIQDVAAYDGPTGALLWRQTGGVGGESFPAIADLEGDGDVEVVVNEFIFDGATGAVVGTLRINGANQWGDPAIADMNGDGTQEIMLENRLYRADGTLIWQCGPGGVGTFPHPVNVDGDPEGEMLVAASNTMTLCDDDGHQLWSHPTGFQYGSAVCVADFDNDGVQEFGFARGGSLDLVESDGSIRWSTPINDSSGLAGCTSWDFDLDGVPEVVYSDEQDAMVFDGNTGAVMIREPQHGSVTLSESPAVADVDGDGHGEWVDVSNSGVLGTFVFGGASGDWAFARPVYNQMTYYGSNINDDLSVPPFPDAPWIAPSNLFRGQPSAIYTSSLPNLHVAVTDVCDDGCDGLDRAEVAVQVWNSGAVTVPAGVQVDVYGDANNTPVLIHTETLATNVPSNGSTWFSFTSNVGELGDGLQVVVDPANAVDECHEDDNTSAADGPDCP